ncbi:DUF4440 domain-containing protein [Leucobacter sp. UT-8R-CII-1-4]|uniref:nuclear transport factor 2 family protein n=1 Tax=Leucobacter sp. UT-8R-CII-1-4 TaxID=3040075 RepID=UPI0024A7F3F7|nr:DUF4440 domain-containing protein [Leucobacter sp. UT-8R-CII-1-4]MDI6022418.1 DUF4440 domain-containing protein [Leucobacter sp. UT-8R-CII-1-4]
MTQNDSVSRLDETERNSPTEYPENEALIQLAWRGEEALLSPQVRGDAARVEALLAPDFTEIGQSGVHWSRRSVVEALVAEPPAPPSMIMRERAAREIAPDVVLVSYRLSFAGKQSLRSALWRRVGETVQCFFHQGTPIAFTETGA